VKSICTSANAAFAVACIGAFALAPGASAEASGDVILDGRLRYEHVEQDGLKDANAATLRIRLGYEIAATPQLKFLGEVEAVAQLNDDFADTVRFAPGQAVVADPEAFEVNRLQAQWTGPRGLSATLGRQRIILNNARFVGNVGFRQNEQTFDALRLGWRANESVNFTYAYLDRIRRVFGDDSAVGEWRSDSHVGQVDVTTPVGQFSGYGLLLDFDNAPAESSRTYGVRWTKTLPLGEYQLGLTAEAANQTDYGDNPLSFDLNYGAAQAQLRRGPFEVSLGAERLEGDGARGFSTPLATLHAFQGWADAFLTTPAGGVRDVNAGASWTVRDPPVGQAVTFAVRYHDFSDDDGDVDYGQETDVLARLRLNDRVSIEAKAAFFEGDSPLFADRTKAWLAIEFSY
jgi:hypothetical protein